MAVGALAGFEDALISSGGGGRGPVPVEKRAGEAADHPEEKPLPSRSRR